MRKIHSIAASMLALTVIAGFSSPFVTPLAGARVVSDSEVVGIYGGVVPVCGNANPIACNGSASVCVYTPCINIVAGTGNRALGTVVYCSSDGSSTCGNVNLSKTCLQPPTGN